MPAYLNDRVLDLGLTVLDTEATKILLCSSQTTTYAAAVAATLAEAALASGGIGAPAARTEGGRKVTVAAASGTIATGGTASHYALVDHINTRLLVASPLAAPQVVTKDNPFTLPAFDVGVAGAA